MSFHEKSAWACLAAIGGVYGPYFYLAWRYPPAALGVFWISALAVAGILVAFHVVNALATRSIRTTGRVPPVDELDRSIELAAARWSGLVLAFAVFTWILFAMYLLPAGVARGAADTAAPTIVAAVQWLFAGFVLANLVYYGGIVVGYRRLRLG